MYLFLSFWSEGHSKSLASISHKYAVAVERILTDMGGERCVFSENATMYFYPFEKKNAENVR